MSDTRIYKLFPVPIFEKKLDNHEELNNQLEEYINNLKKEDPKGQIKSNAGGWHSPFFNMRDTVVKKFISKFNIFLHNIVTDSMSWKCEAKDIVLLNMWSIINPKNTFNIRHHHPNSALSAAYYVKAKKNSGKINFFDPKDVKTMYHPPIKTYNELSSEVVAVEPEEGKLLLFPAYLQHSVGENLSSEDRIVISFNVNIAKGNSQIHYF